MESDLGKHGNAASILPQLRSLIPRLVRLRGLDVLARQQPPAATAALHEVGRLVVESPERQGHGRNPQHPAHAAYDGFPGHVEDVTNHGGRGGSCTGWLIGWRRVARPAFEPTYSNQESGQQRGDESVPSHSWILLCKCA